MFHTLGPTAPLMWEEGPPLSGSWSYTHTWLIIPKWTDFVTTTWSRYKTSLAPRGTSDLSESWSLTSSTRATIILTSNISDHFYLFCTLSINRTIQNACFMCLILCFRSIHAAYSTSGRVSLLYSLLLYEYYMNTIFIYTQLFLHSYVDIWILSSFFKYNKWCYKKFYAYLLVHICIHFFVRYVAGSGTAVPETMYMFSISRYYQISRVVFTTNTPTGRYEHSNCRRKIVLIQKEPLLERNAIIFNSYWAKNEKLELECFIDLYLDLESHDECHNWKMPF